MYYFFVCVGCVDVDVYLFGDGRLLCVGVGVVYLVFVDDGFGFGIYWCVVYCFCVVDRCVVGKVDVGYVVGVGCVIDFGVVVVVFVFWFYCVGECY